MLTTIQKKVNNFKSYISDSENIIGYLFISPWLIGFIAFVAGPILFSFVMSFMRWKFLQFPHFVGFSNFIRAFTRDYNFWRALGINLKYIIIVVPFQTISALLVATLLNQKIKGVKIFRACFYLPSVVSGAVLGILWTNLLNKDLGLFNYLLSFINVKIGWISNPDIALYTLIFISMWAIGIPMVIFLSALQNIPDVYYEAALIDGAGPVRKFSHITLPLISPSILYVIIYLLIMSFKVVVAALVITAGGPAKSTYVYGLHVYINAFQHMRMGYASALAWIMFVITLSITLLILYFSKYWVFYQSERGNKL